MPQVIPPAPAPIQSDFALFAKAYFNIELTKQQLEIVDAIAKGRDLRLVRRRAGVSTAQKVMQAYLLEGLKPGGRVRLPVHPIPPVDKKKMKGFTQEGKILAMIKRPGGAYNFELSRFALKYTSVISALRQDGHSIVADRQYLKNCKASNTWRYRLGVH
jgi:hypothetical protein